MKSFNFSLSPLAKRLAARHTLPSLFLTSIALFSAPQAGAVMMDLGALPGSTSVSVTGISGDGSTAVGYSAVNSEYQFFRWSIGQGIVSIGTFPYSSAEVTGVSGDGSYVVGYSYSQTNSAPRAFRWSSASGLTELGTLGGKNSQANGVSDSGAVVVGRSDRASGVQHAFRRTEAGSMQDLGSLSQDGESIANGVSGDGLVVVGESNNGTINRAFRWDVASAKMVDLGALASGTSSAKAANRDGSVVVGNSGAHAFRWTQATGMQALDPSTDSPSSSASDVSADGSVVVGSVYKNAVDVAFRWTQATGMTALGTLTGTSRSEATGVSDDGRLVVGTSGARSFIWSANGSFAPAVGVMQDLRNLQVSVIGSADTAAQLMSSQTRRLRDLNQQLCIPGAAQTYCLSASAGGYLGEADNDASQRIGQVGGGMRLNENFTVGANGSLAQVDLDRNDARQRSAYALNLWAAYQQNAANGEGWNASAAAAMGTGQNSFKRGDGLLDVQRSSTNVRITGSSQRLAVGYGVAMGSTLLTPEIALTNVRGERQSFTETGVAFPLSVDSATSNERYATFGMRSATPLSPKATLQVSLAADVLMGDDTPGFTGRSQVPGFSRFDLHSSLEKRRVVPVAGAQYSYALSPQSTLAGGVQVSNSPYQGEGAVYGVGVKYNYAF